MVNRIDFTESVNDAKQGDVHAFEFLYQQSMPVFKAKVMLYIKNETEAEDILQDVYVRIYQKLDELKEPKAFIKWGLTICTHTAINALRKKEKKKEDFRPMNSEEDEMGMESVPAAEYLKDADPQVMLEGAETKRLLDEMIDDLPEMQRFCLLLWQEEYSTSEIAERLNIPRGTVNSNVNYAKRKIKDKVLALEKQGTRLYGLSPISFFLWLMRIYEESWGTIKPLPGNPASFANIMARLRVTEDRYRAGENTEQPQKPGAVQNGGKAAGERLSAWKILGILCVVCVVGVVTWLMLTKPWQQAAVNEEGINAEQDEPEESPLGTDFAATDLPDQDIVDEDIPDVLFSVSGYKYIGNQLFSEEEPVVVPAGYIAGRVLDLDNDGEYELVAVTVQEESAEPKLFIEIYEYDSGKWTKHCEEQITAEKTEQTSPFEKIRGYICEEGVMIEGDNGYLGVATLYEYKGENLTETMYSNYSEMNDPGYEELYAKSDLFFSLWQWHSSSHDSGYGDCYQMYMEVYPQRFSGAQEKESYVVNLTDYAEMSVYEGEDFYVEYPLYFDDYLTPVQKERTSYGSTDYYTEPVIPMEYPPMWDPQAELAFPVVYYNHINEDLEFTPIPDDHGFRIFSPRDKLLWEGADGNGYFSTFGGDAMAVIADLTAYNDRLDLYNIYIMITYDYIDIIPISFHYTGNSDGTSYPIY